MTKLQKIPTESSRNNLYQRLLAKALNFVSYKARTTYELAQALDRYLYKRTLSAAEKEQLKEAVIAEIDSMAILDDVQYVKDFCFDVVNSSKSYSIPMIKAYLYKKGLSGDWVDALIADTYTPDIEETMIQRLVAKKLPKRGQHPDDQAKYKLISYLLRKGFTRDVVYTVVDTNFKKA